MPADEFDAARILTIFANHGVDCLIVGGFGAQAHGAHRQTLDIDVVPHATDENLDRLAAALRELGARLRVGGMRDEDARQLPVTVKGGRRTYEDMVGRAIPRTVKGIVVYLASLDDIIASKEHAARDKDRQALPELHELLQRLQSRNSTAE